MPTDRAPSANRCQVSAANGIPSRVRSASIAASGAPGTMTRSKPDRGGCPSTASITASTRCANSAADITAAEAEVAARACRYPPEGFRSWGPTRASLGDPDYGPAAANRDVVCVVMIETVEGVENVREILAVSGVDAILIGPYDLALSWSGALESPGKAPRDRELIGRVLDACAAANVAVATSVGSLEDAQHWISLGVKIVGISDLALLGSASVEALRALRACPRSGHGR